MAGSELNCEAAVGVGGLVTGHVEEEQASWAVTDAGWWRRWLLHLEELRGLTGRRCGASGAD